MGEDPLEFAFRSSWPWEQDRLMAVIHEPRFGVRDLIGVVPDPHMFHQSNWMAAEKRPGTCLAAVPRWRCYFNHFCGDVAMKMFWGNRTAAVVAAQLRACAEQRVGNITLPLRRIMGKAP